MPIYEYRCGACGHEFELLQKITDAPKRKCEACGRLKAKRLISHTSFQLKGSGWYVTDYGGKKGGDATRKSSETSSSKDSSTTSDTKSDSKGESAAA